MSSFGDLNRVNTNIQSLDSQLSLNRINRDLADNQLKLSTGLRINRAEDDAAGYAIATKLNSRVAGLEQALQNVGDAKSVLDIAESSFDTVMDSLIEMKALATQAANDTLGENERGYIGAQIEKLAEDINDVANQTVFQDSELLNGAVDASSGAATNTGDFSLTFQVGERSSDTLTTDLSAVNIGELFAAGGDTEIGAASGAISATAAGTGGQGGLSFDAATADDFRSFIDAVDTAIEGMNERVNEIGMTQSSLSIREVTLSQSISANSSASSRIMDADFAKEQSESVRLQILQQTSTSALAQANMGPQSVLGFLG
ncbi:flagellin [Rhodohalobacter sp. SW132]|uniref:flagellin n=1 Tax=Rhodohalobacter sp. SW132 TaxID=2293433 RepID=UPI000E2669EE|nr:flagellin [Rhodohalobacter sp. SW132]REL38627.1 flagellin [Rhodohalobacter sp. SW132]REL38630.1 flagellin [Rhodohalobacter sp. SW132]